MDQKKMVPVNIGQVVERLLLMYRAQADEKNIHIIMPKQPRKKVPVWVWSSSRKSWIN
jgi:hypothetical protein